MKKAIITLKDGNVFEHLNDFIWSYREEINDTRTSFIEIGKYLLRKDEIKMIEIVEVEDNGTN